jgi:hypothetical protein
MSGAEDPTMTIAFDEQSRAILAGLADALIPAADGLPSASQAGVAGKWLDAVLESRPDLAAPLVALIGKAGGREPGAVIAEFQASDPGAFGVLAELVPGAYYMNPDVCQLVGYPGQVGLEVDMAWPPDWLTEGLLDPVIERGPIYRDPELGGARPPRT